MGQENCCKTRCKISVAKRGGLDVERTIIGSRETSAFEAGYPRRILIISVVIAFKAINQRFS